MFVTATDYMHVYVTVHEQIGHNALEPLPQIKDGSHVSHGPWYITRELILGTAIEVGVV